MHLVGVTLFDGNMNYPTLQKLKDINAYRLLPTTKARKFVSFGIEESDLQTAPKLCLSGQTL